MVIIYTQYNNQIILNKNLIKLERIVSSWSVIVDHLLKERHVLQKNTEM